MQDIETRLTKVIGEEAARAVLQEFAGQRVYFPKGGNKDEVIEYLKANPEARSIEVTARFYISRSTYFRYKQELNEADNGEAD
jgi:hypothetical protein